MLLKKIEKTIPNHELFKREEEPTLEYYLRRNNCVFGNLYYYHFSICNCEHVSFIHGLGKEGTRENPTGKCAWRFCNCQMFTEKEFVIAFNLVEE